MTEKTNSTTAYKGFNKNFKCRDIQFDVGKTYEHKGKVSDPKSGFYACENPLDVLKYYPPTCRFAVVKYDGNACGGIDGRRRNRTSGIDFRGREMDLHKSRFGKTKK